MFWSSQIHDVIGVDEYLENIMSLIYLRRFFPNWANEVQIYDQLETGVLRD